MDLFLQQVVNGLILAGIYLLIALGITLVYGLTRVANFAQGEMVTLGAFLVYDLTKAGFGYGFALLIGTVGVGVASQVLYVGLFRRTLDRHFNGFVISLGLIIMLEAIYALIWPGSNYTIQPPFTAFWHVGPIIIPENQAALLLLAVIIAAVLIVALKRTQAGRGIRAIALDTEAATVLGVPVKTLTALTFMVGCGLAALAGGMLGTTYPFNAYYGSTFLFTAFAIAIVGGLGSVQGAVIAAVLLSLATTLASAYISLIWADAYPLIALIIVLMVRPQGLRAGTQTAMGLGGGQAAIEYSADPGREVRQIPVPGRWGRALQVGVPRAALAVVAAVVVGAPFILGTYSLISDAAYAAVLASAGYAVWFMFRYLGIPNLALFGIVGIGSYSAALTLQHWNFGFWPELAFAVVIGCVASVLMGLVALRTRGAYFLIILFAFSQLIVALLTNLTGLTGGDLGLVELQYARPLGGLVSFAGGKAIYWLAAACLAVSLCAIAMVIRSKFGQRLVTIRDDEVLAESLGMSSFLHKLCAMAIAGGLCGGIGVVFLYQQRGVEPDLFGVFPGSYLLLIMLLGGVGVFVGPIIGAVIFVFIPVVLPLGPNWSQVVNGALLIVLISFLPTGVSGTVRKMYYGVVSSKIRQRATTGIRQPVEAVEST